MPKLLLSIFFSACHCFLSAQPSNDECAGAILLTVNNDKNCTSAYDANVVGATQSNIEPCVSTGHEAKDVWYKFVAKANTHSITLYPTSFTDFVMQVYNGSCNSLSPLTCINNTSISEIEGGTITNLTPGATYYVRVYSSYGWPDMQFRLCVNSNTKPIINDEPQGAIQAPVTTSDGTHYSNIGATLSMPACTGSADNDIWFKFTATGSRHIVRYGTIGYHDYLTAVEVFSGTPGNLVSIKCYSMPDNDADISGLIPGNIYYYRIYIPTGETARTDFYTYIKTPPPGPSNDECAGAILLTVNNDKNCTSAYDANVVGATQSNIEPCVSTGHEAKDVWYKFVAKANTHSITLYPTSFTDFVMQVYNGSCNSLSPLTCINNTSISEIEGGTITNLTPGATYYVRVYSSYGWPDMQFRLCVNSNTKPIINDEPQGAIQAPVTTSDGTHYSNIGATLSMPACTGSADNDIWFKFTATGSRHIVRYGTIGYHDYLTAVEVFSGTPGNLVSIKCYSMPDNDADISGLIPGNIYYYRIYIPTGETARTDFYTYIKTPPPGPSNDECAGAILLTVNNDKNCTSAYDANVVGATQSNIEPCVSTGHEAKDVWYKFVAKANTHSITLYPTSFTDFVMQVYNGSCNSLSPLTCINNTSISEIEGGTITNLTPGATYYVRVYSSYGWPDMQFRLCVNSNTKPIINDEPQGAIQAPVTTSDGTHYSNIGATLSMPACTGSADNDIWFKFTATGSRHIVRYGTIGYHDYLTAVEVFSGTPGNLVSIKCYSMPDNDADISGLIPGNIYYYRIYIPTGETARTDFYTYIKTPTVLASKFLNFNGKNINGVNQLNWETGKETNIIGFDIECSTDGRTFKKLDFIKYADTGRLRNEFKYQHITSALQDYKKLYYRVKEINKDNQYTFSETIIIEQNQISVQGVSIFPNPVNNKVVIRNGDIHLSNFIITDAVGRICLYGKLTSNTIDLSHLKQGTYLLSLSNINTQFKKSFILLKVDR